MASGNYFDSDSDDTFVTEVQEKHKPFMKSKLIEYLSEIQDYSVQILHTTGKPAKLIFDIGSKGKSSATSTHKQLSNTILVKNIPSSYDELHLRMFFEYETEKGGGPVKSVSLNRKERSAIIEFEEAKSADTVLGKRPIQIMGQTVDVEVYQHYLSKDEVIQSLSVSGTDIPASFSRNIASLTESTNPEVFHVGSIISHPPTLIGVMRTFIEPLRTESFGTGIVVAVGSHTVDVVFHNNPFKIVKVFKESVKLSR